MLQDGAGITGHVIRSGEIVRVPDVQRDPRYVEGRAGTRSEIAVPIVRAGRVIGALNLESDRVDAFASVDVETLEFFAEAAGIAIESAVLHERLLAGERFESQMRLAQEVQVRLLPTRPPVIPGYDLAGRCIPTQRIGGDYYDAIASADGRLTLVVADVAGKGVAAALVMAAFRALLRGCLEAGGSLAEVVAKLNRTLPDSLAGVVFVTAFVARLDPASGTLTYVNCGHNPPFIVRDPAAAGEAGATTWLDAGGPVLGAFPEARFEEGSARLAPGDVLVLYTDGVVESADPARTHFGAERLAVVAGRLREKTAPEMIREIVLLTREFSGAVEYDDDFTIVTLKRDGGRSSRKA
jgi:sigma-B regulation protein RsbU (phosphoserine phosphatase)